MVPGVAGELALKMTGCAPGPWGQHCGVGVQGPGNGPDKLAICCCMTFRNNILKYPAMPRGAGGEVYLILFLQLSRLASNR